MADNEDRENPSKEPQAAAETPGTVRIVSLPVFSTKVLAGLETDETMAKVKRAQRKKRRGSFRKGPKK